MCVGIHISCGFGICYNPCLSNGIFYFDIVKSFFGVDCDMDFRSCSGTIMKFCFNCCSSFHNSPGTRSEVHVALYTKARFDDIKIKNTITETWIVTNTKTTTDVNAYAHCVGMKVISWSYPDGDSLRDLIEKTRLYPVTMLTTLNQNNKMTLLNNHVVLCKDLHENHQLLDILPLSKEEKEKALAEINFICNGKDA